MKYEHRNGETEPPTIGGWYWARNGRGATFLIPGVPLVFLAKKRYGKVLFVMELDMPVTDVHAKWWGPVTPPRTKKDTP